MRKPRLASYHWSFFYLRQFWSSQKSSVSFITCWVNCFCSFSHPFTISSSAFESFRCPSVSLEEKLVDPNVLACCDINKMAQYIRVYANGWRVFRNDACSQLALRSSEPSTSHAPDISVPLVPSPEVRFTASASIACSTKCFRRQLLKHFRFGKVLLLSLQCQRKVVFCKKCLW